MTIEKTPTESYIGYDADGIPPRHTSPASRQHTDQHDSTTRIIAPGKLLPPVPVIEPGFAGGTRHAISQADILRSHNHQSPALTPCESIAYKQASPRDLDELDKQLEPLRTHRCRGCACALRPDQPCGSYCQRCNEELVSLESDCTSAWRSLPAWVLIAALAALGLAEVVVGVAWWWGSK